MGPFLKNSWKFSETPSLFPKINYLISFLITTFFLTNFSNKYLHLYNYFTFFFLIHQFWIWKNKLTYIFSQVHEIYILILIEFNIDISNDELLKTIWKRNEKKKKKQLIVTNSVQQCEAPNWVSILNK
jgi:hypothetical protein